MPQLWTYFIHKILKKCCELVPDIQIAKLKCLNKRRLTVYIKWPRELSAVIIASLKFLTAAESVPKIVLGCEFQLSEGKWKSGTSVKHKDIFVNFRYYQLIENAIEPNMVSAVETETVQGIFNFVPKDLRLAVPAAKRKFLRVRTEKSSGRKFSESILAYICLLLNHN